MKLEVGKSCVLSRKVIEGDQAYLVPVFIHSNLSVLYEFKSDNTSTAKLKERSDPCAGQFKQLSFIDT